MSDQAVKILIADDHAMVRDGLKRLLEAEPQYLVTGQATSGGETLAKLNEGFFDLLLLDLTMPAPSGVVLIQRIREHHPRIPILVVTMHNEARMAQAAFRAGANGYITKDSDPELLLGAVAKVLAGGRYASPEMYEAIAFLPTESAGMELSNREQEILSRLVLGQSNVQIAHELFISEKTVSTHKANIMAKLGVDNLADLVRYVQSNDQLGAEGPSH